LLSDTFLKMLTVNIKKARKQPLPTKLDAPCKKLEVRLPLPIFRKGNYLASTRQLSRTDFDVCHRAAETLLDDTRTTDSFPSSLKVTAIRLRDPLIDEVQSSTAMPLSAIFRRFVPYGIPGADPNGIHDGNLSARRQGSSPSAAPLLPDCPPRPAGTGTRAHGSHMHLYEMPCNQ
jgi:hypothetical protein